MSVLLDKFLFKAHGVQYFGAGRTHFPVNESNVKALISGLQEYHAQIKKPCGECHLNIGETCDICGAKSKQLETVE